MDYFYFDKVILWVIEKMNDEWNIYAAVQKDKLNLDLFGARET